MYPTPIAASVSLSASPFFDRSTLNGSKKNFFSKKMVLFRKVDEILKYDEVNPDQELTHD